MRLASDGDGFLATFHDRRFGNEDAVGNRYDANGRPIDDVAFPIILSGLPDFESIPIWNGNEYAVFVATQGLGTFRLTVTPAGEIALHDRNPWDDGRPVNGSWNGSRYAVAFIAGNDLRLRFFDAQLSALESVEVNDATELPLNAAVASDGNNFLVVWETAASNGTRLYERIVDADGNPRTEQRLIASEGPAGNGGVYPAFAPAVSWNGTRYMIAWTQRQSVAAAFVDTSGVIADRISFDESPLPMTAAIAWDGVAHCLIWSASDTETHGALVSSDGHVLDRFTIPGGGLREAVASNGRVFFVITGFGATALVHSTGTQRVTALDHVKAYLPQYQPAITAGPSAALVAWFEGDGVYASRIDRSATSIDGSGIRVGDGAFYGFNLLQTATAGDVHLIAWQSNTASEGLHIARLTAAGELLGAGDRIAGGFDPFAVSSNGSEFLIAVLVSDAGINPTSATLSVELLQPRGAIAPLIPIRSGEMLGSNLQALLWTGSEYALLWRRYLDPPCFSSHCTRRFEERLTAINEQGNVVRDTAIAMTGDFLAAAVHDGSIIIASATNDSIVTRKVAVDGIDNVIATDFRPLRGSLVVTDDGLQLLFDSRMIPLDFSGKPTGPVRTIHDLAMLGNAVRAFGMTLFTYELRWEPLPAADDGFVIRSFFEPLFQRRRSAAH